MINIKVLGASSKNSHYHCSKKNTTLRDSNSGVMRGKSQFLPLQSQKSRIGWLLCYRYSVNSECDFDGISDDGGMEYLRSSIESLQRQSRNMNITL